MRSFCLLLETRVCLCVLDYFSCDQICIFFMHVTLLYLCFTYPCLLPFVISSSSLSFLPTFKYSSISCRLAQVPHCWQRDILPSRQRTTPPTLESWPEKAPSVEPRPALWDVEFGVAQQLLSFAPDPSLMVPLLCLFHPNHLQFFLYFALISGATISPVKVENGLKYEDW